MVMRKLKILSILFISLCLLFALFYNEITVKIPIIGSIVAKDNLVVGKDSYNVNSNRDMMNLESNNKVIVIFKESLEDDRIIKSETIYYLDDKILGKSLVSKEHPVSITHLAFPCKGRYKLHFKRIITELYHSWDLSDELKIVSDTLVNSIKITATNGTEYDAKFVDKYLELNRTHGSFLNFIYENLQERWDL